MSRSVSCDRCNKTIRLLHGEGKPNNWRRVDQNDLCKECSSALSKFFEGEAIKKVDKNESEN